MRVFKNFDTGDIWTEDEIRSTYNSEYALTEAYPTFEAYLAWLLDLGRQFSGGLTEIESPYIVTACGGMFDGEELFWTDDEQDAINFAREHDDEYEDGCLVWHGDAIVLNI